ncbi:MAG: sensor histidine kinase [Candidatus Promineifilaceae bacterium]|nr:sensor histidine kinase [Chloroflexota bacterium]MBP7591516.1 sensor histidine kinase [Chloroflexota bacterium]
MLKLRQNQIDVEVQARRSILIVVVIGYLVTFLGAFSSQGYSGTLQETILAILLGVVYTWLCIYIDAFYLRFQSRWTNLLYFGLQISLIFAIHWLIGPGGIWLVSLPLAAMAVERLAPLWRWPVYLAVLAGMFVSIGFRYNQWESATFFAVSVSPAIFFVVVFTEQGQRERLARRYAEELTADLETANRQLSAYALQAEELATTQERNRLAREIHDNLGHYLTVVNVQIAAAKVLLAADPQRALDALDKAQTLTQEGLGAVRQSVAALRESPLGKRPLPEAISALVTESNNAGIVTELVVRGTPHHLASNEELALYRVAQEGLTNIRKHARASRADLLLDYTDPTKVCLSIVDNGLGAEETTNGFGLLGVRERVHLLGGQVTVKTAVNQGFSLMVCLPTAVKEIT